jgi:plastocyanin
MRGILSSRRRSGAAAAVALAAALVAGSIAPAAGEPPPRTELRAGTAQVSIRDFAFHPATLRVARGTKVVFANRDRTAHTVTRGGSFNTGRIRGGQAASVRFGSRGTFPYHCMIHPSMRGKVVVQ